MSGGGRDGLLETRGLTRAFGGLVAVDAVDVELRAGEIRAVIGPNGAGKTTLVSLISGRLHPTRGQVRFRGHDITALPPWARARLGIVYTFQITSIYRQLSVFDNVALAVQRVRLRTPWDRLGLGRSALEAPVDAALAEVGLRHLADERAGALPYGHQKLVEVAMALALRPSILALDEPTQGLAPDETAALADLIRRIARDTTVLLVEHNIPLVLELATRVTVMDQGRVIAEGTPAEIETRPDVQRAYLGLAAGP